METQGRPLKSVGLLCSYLPTKISPTQNCFVHSGELFFLKEPTIDRFTITTIFLSQTLFSVADNVLKYYIFMDSTGILDHILSTVKEKPYLIQKKKKKRKKKVDLPKEGAQQTEYFNDGPKLMPHSTLFAQASL